MERATTRQLIQKTLREKSSLKLDIYKNTQEVFEGFKDVLRTISTQLKEDAENIDNRIKVEFNEGAEFNCVFKIASDVLIFQMHSNVFEFDRNHPVWKQSYVKQDEANSYCGVINIYNFLADSFKYNRQNDLGYLIARIFINKDKHYFVEGKRQLGFLYNDFVNSVIDRKAIQSIIESTILYCLCFDLLTPPYDAVQQVTVSQVQELENNMKIQTGKRLGYKFQADDDNIPK